LRKIARTIKIKLAIGSKSAIVRLDKGDSTMNQVNWKLIETAPDYSIWQELASQEYFCCALDETPSRGDITWETVDLAVCEYYCWQMQLLEEAGQVFLDI
jgi:hypothetical protein